MMETIRAIYEGGQLRLLDPLDLKEGEAVYLRLVRDPDPVDEVLGDLLIRDDDSKIDEGLHRDAEITIPIRLPAGARPLSEIIIEERSM